MDAHRIRKVDLPDDNPEPAYFLEVEADRWIETGKIDPESITHEQVHAFRDENEWVIGYAERAFRVFDYLHEYEDAGAIT